MKKIIFILIFVFAPMLFVHADEPFYRISFGGNFKNIPLETYTTNKNTKKTIGLKLNNWVFAPSTLSFVDQKKNSKFSKSKNTKNFFFIKFKAKF